ncbi:class I SAM-dependent methyltransferase [Haloechinothrix salitolerans]|uniref:Class I SAM-dependent methyltransferase n=1 Tax=Haloechinothrix salitolerans TaxID=926830 RepID=A0ABW2C7E7_9PSEU
MNLRCEAIIAANTDVLAGARVLDIASHDGRWSFAALHAGAAHVVGIEARKELVDNANETFARYDVDPTRYRFIRGDVFEKLTTEHLDVDVVMCLGFLYHTLRWPELFTLIRALRPRHLIIDTNVNRRRTDRPIVRLGRDDTARQHLAAADAYSWEGAALVGLPNQAAVRYMLETYGFEVESIFDWERLLNSRPGVDELRDYREGKRITLRGRPRQAAN